MFYRIVSYSLWDKKLQKLNLIILEEDLQKAAFQIVCDTLGRIGKFFLNILEVLDILNLQIKNKPNLTWIYLTYLAFPIQTLFRPPSP